MWLLVGRNLTTLEFNNKEWKEERKLLGAQKF